MFDFLNVFFGNVIRFFCEICGNQFWLGILLFNIVINALLLPLNIKQQKGTASQARMRNKLARIKEKCGNDRVKYQEEMSKVYAEAGTSPFSGCLLLFIRLPIFFAIYAAVRESLTYIFGAPAELIEQAADKLEAMGTAINENLIQLQILGNYDELVAEDARFAALKSNGSDLNFELFGLNLFDSPNFGKIDWIWIIPLLSFATSMLMSVYTTINNKKNNPEMAGGPGMGCMMFGMPIFSLILTFNFPGAMGWHWACSNIVSTAVSVAMTKLYSPGKLIAQLEAKEAQKRRAYEQSIINPQAASPAKKSILKK